MANNKDDKFRGSKDKQTTKPGPVEDRGPHGRDWSAQEEFRDDALRMFPRDYGMGVESIERRRRRRTYSDDFSYRVPGGAYWAFAVGTVGLAVGLAWTFLEWTKERREFNAPRQPEKVVH